MERHNKNLLGIFAVVIAIFILLDIGLFITGPTGLAGYNGSNSAPLWSSGITYFGMILDSELVLDLNEYFTDADGDVLSFIATQPNNFTVVVSDDVVVITPAQGFLGTRSVTLTASDDIDVTSQTILIDVLETTTDIKDANNKFFGRKITDEPNFETYFSSIEKTDNQLTVVFYHDSAVPKNIWVEGDVGYAFTKDISGPLEEVILVVQLVEGIVPKFKLHVGEASEIFEFGKDIPAVVTGGNYSLIDRDDELLDVEITREGAAAVIKGTNNSVIKADLGRIIDSEIKTDVFAADDIFMEEAVISLPASGEVNAILECPDFNVDTFVCEGKWEDAGIPFTVSGNDIVFTVDHFSGYAGGYIQIINVQSYPTLNGNWTVRFNTTGNANLTIMGVSGTHFTVDLQFLELKCGNNTVNASYDGNIVFYENFSCNETAYETSKVITEGRHHLNFTFGNSSAVAHNIVVIGSQNVTSVLNASFFGERVGDSAGFATMLADVNNDNSSDLLVGAPNRWESGKRARGKLYLRYGPFPTGSHNLSTSNASWIGAFNFSSLGFSLAKGDFNGDSNADIVTGAYLDNSSGVLRSGSVYLINGGALSGASKDLASASNYHARFSGLLNQGGFGWTVAVGDFNNDSSLDVAIGEPAPFVPPAVSNGTVYIFLGPIAAGNYTSAGANITISGTKVASMRFGQALAVGDMNGDGVDDLMVGAPDAGAGGVNEGEAYVFLGPLIPVPPAINDTNANVTILAEVVAKQTGFSLASGKDINNDTFDDLLVGDSNATNPAGDKGAGKVYLIYGNASLPANINLPSNATWYGEGANDSLGHSVLLSDENNDTLADVIMGAPGNDFGGNNAGSVYFDYAPIPSGPAVNVSTVNGSLFGAVVNGSLGSSLASGSFGTSATYSPYSGASPDVIPGGFTHVETERSTKHPPISRYSRGGGNNWVPGGTQDTNCKEDVKIIEVSSKVIDSQLFAHVKGIASTSYTGPVDVALQIVSPTGGVAYSGMVSDVSIIDGVFKADIYRPNILGTGVISVLEKPNTVCDKQEFCKQFPIDEKKPFKLEGDFYKKDFSMHGNLNLIDNKIHVYYSANANNENNQLPKQAEIEYCNGVEIVKIYADIRWVLADGLKTGALTTGGLCGYCSALYASAMGDASLDTLAGSAAAQITGSVAAGSVAGAGDFPKLGIMPQTLGGGSGTWLGHAVFEESIEGQCKLSTPRPSQSGNADNGITGAGIAGITGMNSADTSAGGNSAGDGGSQGPPGGIPVSGRATEDNPNAKEDPSDLDDVIPKCSPFNHNPEPEPPTTVSPGRPGEVVVGTPAEKTPSTTVPGEAIEVDIPDGEGQELGEDEEDGWYEPYSEGEAPGGVPVAQGCADSDDCPSGFYCSLGKCVLRVGGSQFVESKTISSVSASAAIQAFFPDVFTRDNWVMGSGLVDKCAQPAVIDACFEMYENGYKYSTPAELLNMQNSMTGSVVVNQITGSAVAGSTASGCAAQGESYNCGTGVGSSSDGGSYSQTHLSMMNNAQGAKEHCGGIIACYPCPPEFTPRKTPEWEQPSNPSRGKDKPGTGWVHYCGIDGHMHTVFVGPNGITSPIGNIVPPMEPFEPGLLSYMKSLITGSVVAGTGLPQADLMGTVQELAFNIYENQGEANEFCLEKEDVCSSDGRCLPYCTEKPGPPVPPPEQGPPGPPPPPSPPGPAPTPPPVPGPDDVVDTTSVRDMPSYCTAITTREKVGPISGTAVSRDVDIPTGYELIAGPVSFDCLYDDMDLKFNVPDNFEDIRAFRCVENSCTAVADTHAFSGELICDGLPISEYRRRELLAGKVYLEPSEVEVIERYEALVSSNKKSVATQDYVFEFTGDVPSGTLVGLFSPDFNVPLAANPSIAIISTPLVVEFDQEVPGGIDARITMPFEYTENFDKDSIAVYLLQDGMWIHLESTVEDSTVSAYLYDISKYIQDNKLVFAVMAVRCEACIVSEFKNVYDPGSRDAIILIHGLTSSSKTWQFLIDDYVFNRQPWQIWTFDYPSYMTVDEMSKDLADAIQMNNAKFDNIYIVGHSLGGFIGQRALEIADENPSVYSFINKVKKLILAGNPGKGSPAAKVYDNLFNELLNMRSVAKAFNLNSEVIDDLVEGRQFIRVDGVKYYVIAGTESYDFNLGFFSISAGDVFKLLGVNDGIVTTDSASFIGGEYINEICRDYFEIKLTHTELIDGAIPRRIIARIIASEKALENPDVAYLGYNKYVDLLVDRCNPAEYFVIVGKRITELETPAPLNCNCGNGVCGEGENADNCPQDCEGISLVLCMWLPLLLMLLLLLLVLLTFIYVIRKRVQKKKVGPMWKTGLWFLILLILLILILLWFICAYWHWLNWVVVILAALVLSIDALIPWEQKKPEKLEVIKKGKNIIKKK